MISLIKNDFILTFVCLHQESNEETMCIYSWECFNWILGSNDIMNDNAFRKYLTKNPKLKKTQNKTKHISLGERKLKCPTSTSNW